MALIRSAALRKGQAELQVQLQREEDSYRQAEIELRQVEASLEAGRKMNPVSYTHLDVYKRQAVNLLIFRQPDNDFSPIAQNLMPCDGQ